MATVNLGAIKFNWKGAYNSGTAYVADDVVSSGGSSYICILASTGNAVNDATYWSQMSQAGTDGTDGTDLGTVITTQGDVVYRDASGLQRLAAGTAGQVLQTQGASANPVWGDGGGGMTSMQVFVSSGTWTKPAGVKSVRVKLVGSGAAGNHSGKGGGAGGFSEKWIDVTSISSVSVTVGGSVGGNTAGNTSSFGSHCSATGGILGQSSRGGYGGNGTGGDINTKGGGGDYHDGAASGAGGSSYFGGGQAGCASTMESANDNMMAYGSGGTGVYNGYTQRGTGTSGIVVVYEFK